MSREGEVKSVRIPGENCKLKIPRSIIGEYYLFGKHALIGRKEKRLPQFEVHARASLNS